MNCNHDKVYQKQTDIWMERLCDKCGHYEVRRNDSDVCFDELNDPEELIEVEEWPAGVPLESSRPNKSDLNGIPSLRSFVRRNSDGRYEVFFFE